MSNRLEVRAGDRYGRWSVVSEVARQNNRRRFKCECDCGSTGYVKLNDLRNGSSKSCGCYRLDVSKQKGRGIKHGGKGSPEYRTWAAIIQRCENKKSPAYKHYGARGISMCRRWRHGEGGLSGFSCFLADMGRRPGNHLSLDRIDNNKGYEPGNCRWATKLEQAQNLRSNRVVEIQGLRLATSEAIRRFSPVPSSTVWNRIHKGWDPVAAILTKSARSQNIRSGIFDSDLPIARRLRSASEYTIDAAALTRLLLEAASTIESLSEQVQTLLSLRDATKEAA